MTQIPNVHTPGALAHNIAAMIAGLAPGTTVELRFTLPGPLPLALPAASPQRRERKDGSRMTIDQCKVLDILDKAAKPLHLQDVSDQFGPTRSRPSLERMLRHMAQCGYVRPCGRARFAALPAAGQPCLF